MIKTFRWWFLGNHHASNVLLTIKDMVRNTLKPIVLSSAVTRIEQQSFPKEASNEGLQSIFKNLYQTCKSSVEIVGIFRSYLKTDPTNFLLQTSSKYFASCTTNNRGYIDTPIYPTKYCVNMIASSSNSTNTYEGNLFNNYISSEQPRECIFRCVALSGNETKETTNLRGLKFFNDNLFSVQRREFIPKYLFKLDFHTVSSATGSAETNLYGAKKFSNKLLSEQPRECIPVCGLNRTFQNVSNVTAGSTETKKNKERAKKNQSNPKNPQNKQEKKGKSKKESVKSKKSKIKQANSTTNSSDNSQSLMERKHFLEMQILKDLVDIGFLEFIVEHMSNPSEKGKFFENYVKEQIKKTDGIIVPVHGKNLEFMNVNTFVSKDLVTFFNEFPHRNGIYVPAKPNFEAVDIILINDNFAIGLSIHTSTNKVVGHIRKFFEADMKNPGEKEKLFIFLSHTEAIRDDLRSHLSGKHSYGDRVLFFSCEEFAEMNNPVLGQLFRNLDEYRILSRDIAIQSSGSKNK